MKTTENKMKRIQWRKEKDIAIRKLSLHRKVGEAYILVETCYMKNFGKEN